MKNKLSASPRRMERLVSLSDMLPGLLLGVRVTLATSKESAIGTIVAVGHWYGPTAAQAMVAWKQIAAPGQRFGSGKIMKSGHVWESESAHYLENLEEANVRCAPTGAIERMLK